MTLQWQSARDRMSSRADAERGTYRINRHSYYSIYYVTHTDADGTVTEIGSRYTMREAKQMAQAHAQGRL